LVLDVSVGAVPSRQVLDLLVRGVGAEGQVAVAVALFKGVQPCSGMRPFPAQNDPHPARPPVQVQEAAVISATAAPSRAPPPASIAGRHSEADTALITSRTAVLFGTRRIAQPAAARWSIRECEKPAPVHPVSDRLGTVGIRELRQR